MAHDVFISYSTKDKPVADAACATLEARGIRCWIAPRDILPGMDWGDSIIRAVTESRLMVLIFSSSANGSVQIKREVNQAIEKEVPVIPVRIEDVTPSGSLEYYLDVTHWLDAITPPIEQHLEKLAEDVDLLLKRPSLQPDSSPQKRVALERKRGPTRSRKKILWIGGAIAALALAVLAGLIKTNRNQPPTFLTNRDFTTGDLQGWQSSGDKFSVYRLNDGQWRVTTYSPDKRENAVGQLFQDFTVDETTKAIRFWVHGGEGQAKLIWNGNVVRATRGRSDHEPRNDPETLVCWPLEEYKGDTLRLLIDDDVNGPWGFIGVGGFEFLKSRC
jgi:hypothetical protein